MSRDYRSKQKWYLITTSHKTVFMRDNLMSVLLGYLNFGVQSGSADDVEMKGVACHRSSPVLHSVVAAIADLWYWVFVSCVLAIEMTTLTFAKALHLEVECALAGNAQAAVVTSTTKDSLEWNCCAEQTRRSVHAPASIAA
eukprot:3617721-Amphidinium_carterae.2